MDLRKIKILQAIISDYISTAEPVGSRTIAKKYDLGISSATIRNEMSDLEDMGYLEQPHSSAGRKPSDKGYRLYVDKIMEVSTLSYEDQVFIKNQLLDSALVEVDKLIKQSLSILSDLTKLTCIAKGPSVSKWSIKSIQLMSVNKNEVLLIIITNSGIIKHNLIRLSKGLENEKIIKLNNILNARLKNLSIEQINLKVINLLRNDLRGYEDLFDEIIPSLYESLTEEDSSEVYMEGTSNIFNYPEYNDIKKAKDFLSLLDDKDKIGEILKNDENVTIKIGNENGLDSAKNCSIITAHYSIGGKPLGSIGVIGPTRMPYSKILSIMSKVVSEIDENIGRNYLDDR
ncbi:MAG: heat-inducible transcriptional repressor HrcA [Clostridiaceae bacterium]